METAKDHAASAVSARLFHFMWLVGLRDDGKGISKGVVQDIAAVASGKPLTISTLKKELKKADRKGWLRSGIIAVASILLTLLLSWALNPSTGR